MTTLTAIHIHPIKSCHRVEVDEAVVSVRGLAGDREWQVSAGKKPVTQRQKAVLATVTPTPIEGGLRLSAPGRETIEVARPTTSDATTGSLVGVEVAIGDAGDEAASWFKQLLDDDVRLHAMLDDGRLDLPEAIDVFHQPIPFADIAPVLVANNASVAWLAERASEPFGMERFRPNLVVDAAEPFVEDTWLRFDIGAAQLTQGFAWPRCAVPQVDQEAGTRHSEPAKVMRTHRWCSDASALATALQPIVANNALFGIGCAVGPVGTTVAVGDRVEVHETGPALIPGPSD